MNYNLAHGLNGWGIIRIDTLVHIYHKLEHHIEEQLCEFRITNISDEGDCFEYGAVIDGTDTSIILTNDDIVLVDGMEPERLALAYDLDENGQVILISDNRFSNSSRIMEEIYG